MMRDAVNPNQTMVYELAASCVTYSEYDPELTARHTLVAAREVWEAILSTNPEK